MKRSASKIQVGKNSPRSFSFQIFLFLFIIHTISCATFEPRPVQEMSYTSAAIRAAKEVQADTLAPELFRQANEWFFKAKHEYKFKNFKLAKEYAQKARYNAEQAEFEALHNGGVRADRSVSSENSTPAKPASSTRSNASPSATH